MSRQNGLGEYRATLLLSLNNLEKDALVKLLIEEVSPTYSGESVDGYFFRMRVKTLFGFLHNKLFGSGDCGKQGLLRVVENLDKVKEMLKEFIQFPKVPNQLHISNETVKNVFVKAHAWKRFYERWHLENLSSDKIAKLLEESFSRSVPTELKMAYKTLRIINNGFELADYFFDQQINCRFVVVRDRDKDGDLILATVERPK